MNNGNVIIRGPIGRGLVRLAFPILCSNILQCLSGTVNAFWVGRYLGEAAFTAVLNAQSMMFLLGSLALGITMAGTIQVGQYMGMGNVAGAKRVISTGVMFLSGLAIVLSVMGLVFSMPLLTAMRIVPEALSLAVPYMCMMLLALPGMYLGSFVMSLLVGIGDSTTPLKFVLLSVIVGALATPAFMFCGNALFGVRAGVVGAALAAAAAQIVCLLAMLRHLYRQSHPLRLAREDISVGMLDWRIFGELVLKGVPIGAHILVTSLSSVLMITLVNRFGVETTAAYGALNQLWAYIMMPAIAIAVAISATVAQSVGAQRWDRVNRIALLGIGYSVAATGAVASVVYATDNYAYGLFLPAGSTAVPIASHVNSIVTWSMTFVGIPLALFGVMRAAGAVLVPLLVHIVSLLLVRYPFATVLMERWQADAIWWSFTISNGLDAALTILYYRYGRWRRNSRVRISEAAGSVVPESVQGKR